MRKYTILSVLNLFSYLTYSQEEVYKGGIGRGDVSVVVQNSYLDDMEITITFGGFGRGEAMFQYDVGALGVYFTGISSDFEMDSNWSSGTFPLNEFAHVRGIGTQPELFNVFELNEQSRIYFHENSILTLHVNSRLSVNGSLEGLGKIKIKSDENGTATIGTSTGNVDILAEVGRYIPTTPVVSADGRRAYRLLTMPVKGNTNNSIFANWQNNGVADGATGMDIWSPDGTGLSGNGLEVGPYFSIKKYPTSLPATGWIDIANTKTELLFDSQRNYAFLAFPTGPYGSGIISGYDNAIATTLYATGKLMIGTQSYSNLPSNLHTLLPNPYASPISPELLLIDNVGFRDKIWLWDPKLAPTGGYVVYDGMTGYSNTNGSYVDGSLIQLGQGFMVRPEVNGSTFVIQENHKGINVENGIFARQLAENSESNIDIIRVSLHKQEQEAWYVNDAVLCAFYDGGNSAVDIQDGTKLSKPGENLAIRRNNSNLTVEHRNLLTLIDTIPLRLTGLQSNQNHILKISTAFTSSNSLIGRLQDLHTSEELTFELNNGSAIEYSFNTEESNGLQDRFRIVFEDEPLSLELETSTPILVWPNPVADRKLFLKTTYKNSNWKVNIVNLQGQALQTFEMQHINESISELIISEYLPCGIYYLVGKTSEGLSFHHKFILL